MRVAFNIAKDISGNANTAEIEIWNLAEGNRNAVGKELDLVTLEAGYMPPAGISAMGTLPFTSGGAQTEASASSSNVGIIFKGVLRDVRHRREGADIITTLSCGDGVKALRNAFLSKTYPAGTRVGTVIDDLYKEFEKDGIDRGEWKGLDDLPPFRRPYSVCSSCTQEMDRISRQNKLYWSLQNEALEIVPGNGYIEAAAFLSPSTGLIGTPTITDNGVQVEALLNPEIRPNRKVVIESQTLSMNAEGGAYRVSEVVYTGDNKDGDFRVIVTGERIEGGKVDEGVKN
ncbi:baseplate hub protein [Aureimonas fodinaquatilis]|nr:hypothetical protein [Aureimonas fodinaquatilis]